MMRFRTFLLISLVIVFFACLPLIIFEVIGEGEPVIALAWIGLVRAINEDLCPAARKTVTDFNEYFTIKFS